MIDKVIYLMGAFVWSVLGFTAGVWASATSRHVRRIADAIARKPPSGDTVDTTDPVDPTVRPRRRVPFRVVVGVVLIVLGVLSVILTGVQQSRIAELAASARAQAEANAAQDAQDREIVRCLTAYANAFADALDARSGASGSAQDALDEWMTRIDSLINNPTRPDPAVARQELQRVFGEYLTKRAHAKEQQKKNPYPPAIREC